MTVADPIIALAVSAFVTVVISALTKAKPDRPDWLPVVLALILGPLCYFAALYRRDHLVNWDVVIDALFWGVPAGLGAIGIHAANHSADTERRLLQEPRVIGGTGKQVNGEL